MPMLLTCTYCICIRRSEPNSLNSPSVRLRLSSTEPARPPLIFFFFFFFILLYLFYLVFEFRLLLCPLRHLPNLSALCRTRQMPGRRRSQCFRSLVEKAASRETVGSELSRWAGLTLLTSFTRPIYLCNSSVTSFTHFISHSNRFSPAGFLLGWLSLRCLLWL